MSHYTTLIPPDVPPPEPPGTKTVTFLFSTIMTLLLLAFIGFICIDFIADFTNIPLPYDTTQEQVIQAECGPFISDFLGMSFPGQYALKFGKLARFKSYPLTNEDRIGAIQRLQNAVQEAEMASVEIISNNTNQQYMSERFFLVYDNDLATELCTHIDSIADTVISPLDEVSVPDIVFTFYPSDVKINMRGNNSTLSFYITLGKGMQRWEGSFGSGLAVALLNSPLLVGGTVHSKVSERIPNFLLDSLP